jgi:uncharacterized protein YcfJ
MTRYAFALIALGLAVTLPAFDAEARSSRTGRGAVVGGLSGAAIGGLAGGGRGAAIGTLAGMGVGAVMGQQMDRRHGNHYWINNGCWVRNRHGEFHPVSSRYCR